jgi:hypothetical protein
VSTSGRKKIARKSGRRNWAVLNNECQHLAFGKVDAGARMKGGPAGEVHDGLGEEGLFPAKARKVQTGGCAGQEPRRRTNRKEVSRCSSEMK